MTPTNTLETKQPSMLYIASFSELWERFSFYIVEALLVVYLIESKHLSQSYSYQLLGTYISNSFIFTVIGSYFGQRIIGFKYAVNLGALLMAIGYACLLSPNLNFLYHGLSLIVVGSAFFKPNMACFVGSLYTIKTDARYYAGYNIYYASIMLGVIFSTSVSGYVLHVFGWDANFSIASICMVLAFSIFWLGYRCFVNTAYNFTSNVESPVQQWLLTLCAAVLLWFSMHFFLIHTYAAEAELIVCLLIVVMYLVREIHYLYKSQNKDASNALLKFIACIVLLIFSCVYWALLFQLFFSLNLMVKFIIDRQFLGFELPSPLFMGIESIFVVLFSIALTRLWAVLERKKTRMKIFTKYTIAFTACCIGFAMLIISLQITSKPHFIWVITSYAFIGLGEAILAPTALAMIAQLNREHRVALMMAILYVFWGFGTKIADIIAQWSLFPPALTDPNLIAPYFNQAIIYYAAISLGVAILAYLGRYFFRV